MGRSFGTSEAALNEIAELRGLYDANADNPTVAIKRGLWEDLLGSALGEVVSQTDDPDGMFVRHTYLAAATALALQASFGLDIEGIAASDPRRLIDGTAFAEQVGVRGVIESDFFGWPTEVAGGARWTQGLANRVGRFDWESADYDIGSVLGDSLHLRSDVNTLLGHDSVTVHTDPALSGGAHFVLEFPKTLVDSGDHFDALLLAAAADIEDDVDPRHTLDAAGMEPGADREMLLQTLKRLQQLHNELNHKRQRSGSLRWRTGTVCLATRSAATA